MDTIKTLVELSFGPGDGSIFILISIFIGLASGRWSALWLAVLVAISFDISAPSLIILLDGDGFELAKQAFMSRATDEGGTGVLVRTVGYFGSITSIILLKKALGSA